MPKLRRETYGSGDQTWLASTHGITNAPTGTLDLSTFTKATHYPDGYIPSGTPVDVTDLGAVKPHTAPAEGGPALKLGFILFDLPVDGGEVNPAAILRHGSVVAEKVPGTFTAPASAPGFIFE